jgi:phage repressor protein C with HTH and peptisase S24 domain
LEKQGIILKKRMKQAGYDITRMSKELAMSRQNLNYHLRKEPLDSEFLSRINTVLSNRQSFSTSFSENGNTENEPIAKYGNVKPINDIYKVMEVPLVNQYAYAGYTRGFSDHEYVESLPKFPWLVDREYKGNYITFEVRGDSMDDGSRDSYIEGDKVLCREISPDHWKNKLHFRKWDFVIVHKTDGILLKRIIEHKTNTNEITIHSLNDIYPDEQINLKDIAQLFNVVQVQRRK